jgi:RHS repeat-associated protein
VGRATDEQRYLYGNAVDQILAQENVTENITSADRVLWHLVDNLGTVRDLIDNSATLDEHYEYDSYGEVQSGDTSVTRYLFTSRELDDDVDLQYNRARWYDPEVGRWIGEDPIGFEAGDANLSRYVTNSPVVAIDPAGLQEQGRPPIYRLPPPTDDRDPFGPPVQEWPPWIKPQPPKKGVLKEFAEDLIFGIQTVIDDGKTIVENVIDIYDEVTNHDDGGWKIVIRPDISMDRVGIKVEAGDGGPQFPFPPHPWEDDDELEGTSGQIVDIVVDQVYPNTPLPPFADGQAKSWLKKQLMKRLPEPERPWRPEQ